VAHDEAHDGAHDAAHDAAHDGTHEVGPQGSAAGHLETLEDAGTGRDA
jgi:hypothetical protein